MSLRDELDENLVKLAQNGDTEAYGVLVERYQRRVFNVCYGVVRNHDDATDLAQDAFIKAFRSLSRFRGNSKFYTWIYRIAKNVCIDHIRKQKRRNSVEFDDAVGHDEPVSPGASLLPSALGINPARVAGRRELLDQIDNALSTLSENHREVIVLREIEGLSYQEIAETVDISIGTVMSRLFHARKNMQSALSDYVGSRFGGED